MVLSYNFDKTDKIPTGPWLSLKPFFLFLQVGVMSAVLRHNWNKEDFMATG